MTQPEGFCLLSELCIDLLSLATRDYDLLGWEVARVATNQ